MRSFRRPVGCVAITCLALGGRADVTTTRTADAATRPAEAFQVTVDAAGLTPEMATWAHEKLEPVCRAWYPKIVDMLPGDGFAAPRAVVVEFRSDMDKTPAYTSDNRISCNIAWFEANKDGESIGAVVHEMVHVVQQYKFGEDRVPFWLQEGIPDYIRWYLYEPERHGTTVHDVAGARYDDAYRTTANFLHWATERYDKDLVKKLNTAVREGRYTNAMWKDLAGGKTLDELNVLWKGSLEQPPATLPESSRR